MQKQIFYNKIILVSLLLYFLFFFGFYFNEDGSNTPFSGDFRDTWIYVLKLKENILLQAELLDLKADDSLKATGIILESKIDSGRGPIATIVVMSGTLKKGDYFVSGINWGKARALINDKGENIDQALPSMPIELLGINKVPKAGDDFVVVESESKAKEINNYRKEKIKSNKTESDVTKYE